MIGLGGANCLEIHACMCGSRVRKYYTSNFVRTRGHPYNGFNDKSLDHELHVFAFLNPNTGVTYRVFIKTLKVCSTSISDKGKTTLVLLTTTSQIETMTRA